MNQAERTEVRTGGREMPGPEAFRKLKAAFFDVDGVLTDGRIIMDEDGTERKCFDVRDGSGLGLLRLAGFKLGLLSGRRSSVTDARAKDLKIPPECVRHGVQFKQPAFKEIIKEQGLTEDQCVYVGDDLIDLPVLRIVGIACCPANARPEVIAESHIVSAAEGGRGAVRQICEYVLKARQDDVWAKAVGTYLGDVQ